MTPLATTVCNSRGVGPEVGRWSERWPEYAELVEPESVEPFLGAARIWHSTTLWTADGWKWEDGLPHNAGVHLAIVTTMVSLFPQDGRARR